MFICAKPIGVRQCSISFMYLKVENKEGKRAKRLFEVWGGDRFRLNFFVFLALF